mmetsp:Transcript_17450/g.27920  ORF Transcript_17450/g.27920 Transcript_17450/m.27920 type:complete len:172 (+) Transcript_17450:55-570(+)
MTTALLQSATVLPRRCANSRRPGIHPSSLARRGVFRWNAGAVDDGAGAADEVDSIDRPQPQQSTSFSRYSVLVKRPLGLVLETDSQGDIFVVEVVANGNAFKSGLVNVGDKLLAVSAVVFNKTTEYGEVNVRSGEETIKFMTKGERFDTVMAAIQTNPSQRLVTLDLQKCI